MNPNPASATVRTTFQETTRVQWSSDSADDSFPVHNPATGEVITVVQGGGEGDRSHWPNQQEQS